MAVTGRKPKPTAIKKREGNPGKRRMNTREPKPRGDLAACPDWLPADGKRCWARTLKALPERFVTPADFDALTAYCEQWATYVAASKAVHTTVARGGGVTVKGYRGSRVKNVALQVQRDALTQVRAYQVEFGMTPSSRGRIEMPGPKKTELPGILTPVRVRERALKAVT